MGRKKKDGYRPASASFKVSGARSLSSLMSLSIWFISASTSAEEEEVVGVGVTVAVGVVEFEAGSLVIKTYTAPPITANTSKTTMTSTAEKPLFEADDLIIIFMVVNRTTRVKY